MRTLIIFNRNYVDDPADLRDVLEHLFQVDIILIDTLTHWLLVIVLIFAKLIVFSQEGRHEGGVPPMPLADIQVLYRRHLLKICKQDLHK